MNFFLREPFHSPAKSTFETIFVLGIPAVTKLYYSYKKYPEYFGISELDKIFDIFYTSCSCVGDNAVC